MRILFYLGLVAFLGGAVLAGPGDGATAAEPLRTEICLNGTWKLQVDGFDELADVRVPGSFAGQDQMWGRDHWDVWGYPKDWYHRPAVYHKMFEVPEKLENRRVLIHFGAVRHIVTVEVNGKEAGRWSDSYVPFAFDITDLVQAGENQLKVYIAADRTCGLFEDYNQNRRGIYQDVHLQFMPEVRVTPENFIRTSVADKMLAYDVPVRNDGDEAKTVSLRFKVLDGDGQVAQSWSDHQQVTIAPGEVKTINISRRWEDPNLWSIDDPYLYHIETEVVSSDQSVLDRHRLRFGFREITWEGPHLYLNGHEIFLRGHGGHPSGDLQHSKEYAEMWIKQLKANDFDVMRLHDFPRDDALYDAADEMGFLLLSEAAHHFRLPPLELQLSHVERMIKRLRNRPSVLMWSVGNELHWQNIPEPVHLIKHAHTFDTTRPVYNSDFSDWSVHGDIMAHHYDAAKIWSDWERLGPDKVVVWDEIGNVWQQDRPLKPGPAGYEISSQDVAAGIWRDGWEQVRNDLEIFVDGKEFNGEFYRVNLYVPWEFSYVFFRYQPVNNFQRLYLEYDEIEGTPGMKPKFVNPCSSTHNIWDPTLPEFEPNPGLFCFNEYTDRVRFPDEPKVRTFFSGQTISRSSRLFYEDYRPADVIEFSVETPDGKVLTSEKRAVKLVAGEYVPEFHSKWMLPEVDSVTPVQLVRQFSKDGEVGYRRVDEAKIYPAFKSIDLDKENIAVVGQSLQELFGGAGAPVQDAKTIIAGAFDPAWKTRVAEGAHVLVLPEEGTQNGRQLSHYSLNPKGTYQDFSGPVEGLELADGQVITLGTPGMERSALTDIGFNIENPAPGAWVTFDLKGSVDFSTTGLLQLDFGLWTPPDDMGYDKPFADAGGAPFYRKTVRPLLRDSTGRWFVCSEKDEGEMTRAFPTALYGTLIFDCLLFDWKPVQLEPGAMVETGASIRPDFSRVSAVGFVFGDTNPDAPVQMSAIQLRGGAGPSATVQPGSSAHALLEGLGQEDFSFWREGSSAQVLPMPEGRNVRRVLFGTKDGSGSALQETFVGKGVILESALRLNLEEPVAGFMLNRMVDYLATYQPSESVSALSVVGEGSLGGWLESLGADTAENGMLTAVDARDAEALNVAMTDLRTVLEQGGTVLFSQVTPETIEMVREICDRPLRLTEPYFGQRFYCIKAPVSWIRIGTPREWVDYYDGILAPYPFEPNYSPLLAGVANLDLDWKRTRMFDYGIEIEGMNPVSATADHQILISNWHIGSEGTHHLYGENLNGVRDLRQSSWFVNRDPVVLELKARNGRVVISQFDLAAGGDKAKRVMQTLLTNLGVSFDGAMPAPADTVYESGPRDNQLERFALYNTQIDPVARQHYGIPDPMPDYLQHTQINASTEQEELPLLGFFGDPLTLGLAAPLENKLKDVVRMDKPGVLYRSRSAGGLLKDTIGEKKYARVVFSLGEVDADVETTDEDYLVHLQQVLEVLKEHSQKIYWVPAPSAYGKGETAARARELNHIAAEFFDGKDVYMLPFVYADQAGLPEGYFSDGGEAFSSKEADVLADRLGDAVISFGAQ